MRIRRGSSPQLYGTDAHLDQHFLRGDLRAAKPRDPDRPAFLNAGLQSVGQPHHFVVGGGVAQIFVVFLENRAVGTDSLGEDLLDERRKRGVVLRERAQILEGVNAAPDLLSVAVDARQRTRHLLELLDQAGSGFFRSRPGIVEQRLRQNGLIEVLLVNFVFGAGDHAKCGEHVGDDLIVRERASLGEAARNSRIQKRGLERASYSVRPIHQAHVAPPNLSIVLGVVGD